MSSFGRCLRRRQHKAELRELSVFPDDHRHTALTKLGAFLARRAAERARCGARLWRHLAFRNWFQVLSWFRVHSRVSWADSDFKVRRGGTPRPAREARALPRHYVFA